MPSDKPLDPTAERAQATEAMETTPISGKQHTYRADGDHRPRPDTATDAAGAPPAGVEAERHIAEGIPGAGRASDAGTAADTPHARNPRG